MLITPAFAQSASMGPENSSAFASLWVFAIFFAIMYFFIIRPQRTQMKKREEMLQSISRGDSVLTGGGILAKVIKVNNNSGELVVEIAKGLEVTVLRSTISDVRVKGQPAALKETTDKPKASKNSSARKPKENKAEQVTEVTSAEADIQEKDKK